MISSREAEMIVYLWIGFLLLMLAGLGLVFLWAVRARQFSDQQRVRFLPLESGMPEETEPSGAGEKTKDEEDRARR